MQLRIAKCPNVVPTGLGLRKLTSDVRPKLLKKIWHRLFQPIPIITDFSNNWPDYEHNHFIGSALLLRFTIFMKQCVIYLFHLVYLIYRH